MLTASRRLTKSAMPSRIRKSVADAGAVMSAARDEVKRQTGADQIQAETITRFTRSQVIQLVLLVALVYVAYPFISTVPAFFSELRTANWWWALLGLAVSALTYVGAAAALWACADGLVSFRNLVDHAGGQHVRRDHHPGRCRRAGAVAPGSCRRAVSARCAPPPPWRCSSRCR